MKTLDTSVGRGLSERLISRTIVSQVKRKISGTNGGRRKCSLSGRGIGDSDRNDIPERYELMSEIGRAHV